MKNKILNLIKSAVWFVLCLFVGALIFEGIRSFANSNEPAKELGTTVFTKKGHDYLLVDTKHGVCVIHAESCPCHKKKQRMKVRLAKKIMKHKCTFLDLEEKYKKKGYNVKWLLAWASYDKRKMCRNALPFDHRITKAISLTRKK